MDMHGQPRIMIGLDQLAQLLRRNHPDAVLLRTCRWLVIMRPTQPGGKALNGAVHDQFDNAKTEFVRVARDAGQDPIKSLAFGVAQGRISRHQAQRKGFTGGGCRQAGQCVLAQVIDQVSRGGDASQLRYPGKIPDTVGGLPSSK